MTIAEGVWFATALALLASDIGMGRRRLLPYMATLLVTSVLVTRGVSPAADLVLRTLPLLAWAWVLRGRVGTNAASALVGALAVAAVLAAAALPRVHPAQSWEWRLSTLFGAQVGVAAATLWAYIPVARAHTARPAPVDIALVAFSALDFSIGLAALVETLTAALGLWEFWDGLSYLNSGVFVAIAACYWVRR